MFCKDNKGTWALANSCTSCGAKFTFFGNSSDAGNGLCLKCDGDRYQKALIEERERHRVEHSVGIADAALAKALDTIVVSTETIVTDWDIAERLGIVGADVAFGAGPLKDIAVGFSNAFGGRSETMRKLMRDTRAIAIEELKREAHELGANAIIGVAFSVTDIGQVGSMTLMCVTGTAVKVRSPS
jgi:uncharacterized protein YbjQ (UPF0145 family)